MVHRTEYSVTWKTRANPSVLGADEGNFPRSRLHGACQELPESLGRMKQEYLSQETWLEMTTSFLRNFKGPTNSWATLLGLMVITCNFQPICATCKRLKGPDVSTHCGGTREQLFPAFHLDRARTARILVQAHVDPCGLCTA